MTWDTFDFLVDLSLETSRLCRYRYFSKPTVYFMKRNKKGKNIAPNSKYLHSNMTSYICYLDHLLFSILPLHSQIHLSNPTFTNTRGICVYDACKSFNSSITIKAIYSHIIGNIEVSQVTPPSQVTPFYGGCNKSENLENAFSGIVATSQAHTKVLTCGWRERIIKILKKGTPACNNRS